MQRFDQHWRDAAETHARTRPEGQHVNRPLPMSETARRARALVERLRAGNFEPFEER